MARELLFQTECGASGDMILAALIDLLDLGADFKKTFEDIGLPVTINVENVEKSHLRCKQVTVTARKAGQATTWKDIEKFIAAAPLSAAVKTHADRVFTAIFAAEAGVHGKDLKDVHLHEVGADDSLVDILGFCWLWEKLDFCPIYFTVLVTGSGSVRTRHGVLPVPPPAVLRLVQGLVCRSGGIEDELLTPTGAAILTSCGRQADGQHSARPLKTGCGCGHKTFAGMPNLLRAILQESTAPAADDRVWVLESNLDDMSPEMLAHAAEKIVQAGALDIFIAPGLMKKGRPGFQLTVLCDADGRAAVTAAIFSESTTIGLRQRLEDRLVLQRETRVIQVEGRPVRLKVSSRQERVLNIKPEFADIRKLAEGLGVPVKEAMRLVQGVMNAKHGSGQD